LLAAGIGVASVHHVNRTPSYDATERHRSARESVARSGLDRDGTGAFRLASLYLKETDVADPAELRIENLALVFIDHQPWVAFSLEVDGRLLINNVTAVARAAKFPGVPTVLRSAAARARRTTSRTTTTSRASRCQASAGSSYAIPRASRSPSPSSSRSISARLRSPDQEDHMSTTESSGTRPHP
jgi:hypothetical protein